jgi:hypothetical protein
MPGPVEARPWFLSATAACARAAAGSWVGLRSNYKRYSVLHYLRPDLVLSDHLEHVLRPSFRARDLQLRHGATLEEFSARDRKPAGPSAGSVPAGAIGGDTGAGVHVTI